MRMFWGWSTCRAAGRKIWFVLRAQAPAPVLDVFEFVLSIVLVPPGV